MMGSNHRLPRLLVGLILLALAGPAAAQESRAAAGENPPAPRRAAPWSPAVLELFDALPILEDGRIKPLYTSAGFMLLRMNGKRSCKTPAGERLGRMEWFLDGLFYPQAAREYPVFSIQDDAVLDDIGLAHKGKKKRDRYSYAELKAGREQLFTKAQAYGHKDAKEREPAEDQVIRLANDLHEFEMLTHALSFARGYDLPPSKRLEKLFAGAEHISHDDAIAHLEDLKAAYDELSDPHGDLDAAARKGEQEAIERLWESISVGRRAAGYLAIFPPEGSHEEHPEWLTAADVIRGGDGVGAKQKEMLANLREMVAALSDGPRFEKLLRSFQGAAVELASSRGEYERVPLEVFYYKADLIYWSLVLFVLSFVIIAVSWMWPAQLLLRWVTPAMTTLAVLLLAAAIGMRCAIRGRPPVSTLYESILFITAVASASCLIIELFNRRRIAIAMAALLGALGTWFAYLYEVGEGRDTMPQLMAVLDTNKWLAIHVTTISMGYGAGLLASGLAHVYLLGRLVGLKRRESDFYSTLIRMVYGVTCFGLFFALVGTITGGIWANDSWGRFWGWDPKENGALLIVLWMLLLLHARLGGYIRDIGLAAGAVLGGIVVAFSWWGVNLLGVGLHSYGFTSGIGLRLMIFYCIELVVAATGIPLWLAGRIAGGSTGAGADSATP